MKLLNSIARLPRMADAFYKSMKRNEKPTDNKDKENLAIRAMRPYVEKGNESQFYDKLLAYLDTTFTKQELFIAAKEPQVTRPLTSGGSSTPSHSRMVKRRNTMYTQSLCEKKSQTSKGKQETGL